MAQIPIPPQPEPDPQGNPTAMILDYVRSHGGLSGPNVAQNIRTVIEQAARDPSLIPGLRSDRPATEAEDQAAMAAARGGRGGNTGGRGSGGGQDASKFPVPPIPPSGGPPGSGGGGSQNTSAQPSPDLSSYAGAPDTQDQSGVGGGPLGAAVALGIPAATLWAASKFGGAGGANPNMSAVPNGVPPPLPPPELGGPTIAPTPLEPAMQKALAPAGPEPVQPPLEGVKPFQPSVGSDLQPVQPGIGAGNPTGPMTTDPAVVNEAAIASGKMPAPRVPFRPRVPGAGGGLGRFLGSVGRL